MLLAVGLVVVARVHLSVWRFRSSGAGCYVPQFWLGSSNGLPHRFLEIVHGDVH